MLLGEDGVGSRGRLPLPWRQLPIDSRVSAPGLPPASREGQAPSGLTHIFWTPFRVK